MPARPGSRDSCGPRFLTTTSWLPSDFVDVQRDALLRAAEDHHRQGSPGVPAAPPACSKAPSQKNGTAASASGSCRWHRPAATSTVGQRRTISTSVAGTAIVSVAARSITTCVTAVVSGSTSLKLVPWPARGGGLDAAAQGVDFGAHHVHADAAAGEFGHRCGGGEARA